MDTNKKEKKKISTKDIIFVALLLACVGMAYLFLPIIAFYVLLAAAGVSLVAALLRMIIPSLVHLAINNAKIGFYGQYIWNSMVTIGIITMLTLLSLGIAPMAVLTPIFSFLAVSNLFVISKLEVGRIIHQPNTQGLLKKQWDSTLQNHALPLFISFMLLTTLSFFGPIPQLFLLISILVESITMLSLMRKTNQYQTYDQPIHPIFKLNSRLQFIAQLLFSALCVTGIFLGIPVFKASQLGSELLHLLRPILSRLHTLYRIITSSLMIAPHLSRLIPSHKMRNTTPPNTQIDTALKTVRLNQRTAKVREDLKKPK
ncbi:hypothetical protein MMH89_01925 [Candidatus Comchoanobacter bicostacola]|uniref:Uncharacterized protein n=1 Tax=Candidatus Comchoanobacter bicostacola TaxID=2919598 RepID=A0ABY5DKY8_9GAMM|nr:hypothetical protein [Candidatus Comchoanobacter bicostacola]UTC24906.1 hypothetical protein MMH89_01925 [Candidatus Comchoanobacter bicostacola]